MSEPPYQPGLHYQESTTFDDLATGRRTRRVTSGGRYNQTPTYHYNACFTADSSSFVLCATREDGSALLQADAATGALTIIAAVGTDGPQYSGMDLCCIQARNACAAVLGQSLRLFDLETLSHRVLFEDDNPDVHYGHPIATPDGRRIILTRSDGIVRDDDGNPIAKPTTYLDIDIESGEAVETLREDVAGNNHSQPCPAEGDLWLIDRDWPPGFGKGGDNGKTTRCWLYHRRTEKLTEIRPRDPNRFQIHTNWNRDGSRVMYHGRSLRHGGRYPDDYDGQYVGVADTAGNVLFEHWFPHYYYGHMTTDARGESVISDGIVTPHQVTAIHYEDLDAEGNPRLETLCQHDTKYAAAPGQYPHCHCHMSPDGRWLTYNRGHGNRSDVFVVDLAS